MILASGSGAVNRGAPSTGSAWTAAVGTRRAGARRSGSGNLAGELGRRRGGGLSEICEAAAARHGENWVFTGGVGAVRVTTLC